MMKRSGIIHRSFRSTYLPLRTRREKSLRVFSQGRLNVLRMVRVISTLLLPYTLLTCKYFDNNIYFVIGLITKDDVEEDVAAKCYGLLLVHRGDLGKGRT